MVIVIPDHGLNPMSNRPKVDRSRGQMTRMFDAIIARALVVGEAASEEHPIVVVGYDWNHLILLGDELLRRASHLKVHGERSSKRNVIINGALVIFVGCRRFREFMHVRYVMDVFVDNYAFEQFGIVVEEEICELVDVVEEEICEFVDVHEFKGKDA